MTLEKSTLCANKLGILYTDKSKLLWYTRSRFTVLFRPIVANAGMRTWVGLTSNHNATPHNQVLGHHTNNLIINYLLAKLVIAIGTTIAKL